MKPFLIISLQHYNSNVMTVKQNDQRFSIKQFHLKTVLEDANVAINISQTVFTTYTWLV